MTRALSLLHTAAPRFSVVKTYCGHGIGDLFHCAPNIPHYAHNKAVGVMKVGGRGSEERLRGTRAVAKRRAGGGRKLRAAVQRGALRPSASCHTCSSITDTWTAPRH